MNSFETNKVAGAVLGTLLFAFGTGFLAELIYTPKPAGNAGYALPGGSEGGEHGGSEGGGKEAAAPKAESIATLLASADVAKGKSGTKACQACHNFEEGAGAKVGPDLYNVVGRPKGSFPGFDYSAGMKAKGGDWTYADLDEFLTKPSAYIKGTKMSYQGIASAPERANVIGYLRTLSKDPKPLPAADKKEEGKAAEGDKKPAEGDAKAAEGGGGDPVIARVASADAAKGKGESKVCQACHSLDKGGPNKVGPDLWGVVGRKKGSHEGFGYSDAMKSKGGDWTIADLDQFLTKPGDYVKGTKMSFAGISAPEKRAALIAYLHTLSDNPVPLAAPAKAEGKTDDAKPAEKTAEPAKKAEEAKPAEKPADAKPAETKPAEGEKKTDDAKPAEPEKKAEEAKPAEKPADAKPAETKPAEGEKKADDAKPAETPTEPEKKVEDTKPAAKPAETTPAEADKAAEKPAEAKPSENQPSESKPAEGEKPAAQ